MCIRDRCCISVPPAAPENMDGAVQTSEAATTPEPQASALAESVQASLQGAPIEISEEQETQVQDEETGIPLSLIHIFANIAA